MEPTRTTTGGATSTAGTTLQPAESRVPRQLTDIVFDPVMVIVFLVAMACCVAGVMATIYVIRKKQKQRREFQNRSPSRQPIYYMPV
ncbi:hypothetical protein V1264_008002 [Littorina saxatilis]|uniref:Uncharacterized protein n=1 Tax=Littorina saxatilis TaxID=31220 RepID=A0AAN9ATB5_9CAEN